MFNETYKKLSLSPTSSRFKIYARNPLTEEIYKILHLRIEDKERAFNISEHKIHILNIKFARENREYLHRFIGKNLSTFIGKNMKIYLHANKKNPEIHLMSLCVHNPIVGSYFAKEIFKKARILSLGPRISVENPRRFAWEKYSHPYYTTPAECPIPAKEFRCLDECALFIKWCIYTQAAYCD